MCCYKGFLEPWLPGFRAWLVLGPAPGARVVRPLPPYPSPPLPPPKRAYGPIHPTKAPPLKGAQNGSPGAPPTVPQELPQELPQLSPNSPPTVPQLSPNCPLTVP